MDIKELALKVAKETWTDIPPEWFDRDRGSVKEKILDYATRLIAAYLKEQEPVAFEDWWKSDGQYCRAGGGAYEKTFAYEAWNASARNTVPPLPAIPDGCVVVPREPTKEMVAASWNAAGYVRFSDGQEKYIAVAYQAMIAAYKGPSNE